MLVMASIQLSRELSNNIHAVRKRQYRVVLKEKKRRAFFVHEYVRTKYPNIYTEANSMYQILADKYSEKVDFTKLYYFKKWQKKMDRSTAQLYVPHLPILRRDLCTTSEEPQQQEEPEQQESEHQEPQQQEEPEQQESEQQEPQQQEEPEQQESEQQEGQQQSSHQQQNSLQDDFFSSMSINEMSIAVDEMVKALQSDQELMDLVEGFDLPDSVWDNELAIPDYVLESDLEW